MSGELYVIQAEAAHDDEDDEDIDLFVEDRAGAFDEVPQQQDESDDEAAGPGPGSMRLQQQEAAGKGEARG